MKLIQYSLTEVTLMRPSLFAVKLVWHSLITLTIMRPLNMKKAAQLVYFQKLMNTMNPACDLMTDCWETLVRNNKSLNASKKRRRAPCRLNDGLPWEQATQKPYVAALVIEIVERTVRFKDGLLKEATSDTRRRWTCHRNRGAHQVISWWTADRGCSEIIRRWTYHRNKAHIIYVVGTSHYLKCMLTFVKRK